MEGGRSFGVLKKSRLILENSNPIAKKMQFGEIGNILARGIIIGERREELSDYREIIFRTIKFNSYEDLANKKLRID